MSNDVIIKNHQGQEVTYPEVSKVVLRSPNGLVTYYASGGRDGQANWLQNDETASDYIKNKPFYDKSLISECNFDPPPEDKFDGSGYTFWKVADFTLDRLQLFSSVFDIWLGSQHHSLTPSEKQILLEDQNILAFQFAGSNYTYDFAICYNSGTININFGGMPATLDIPSTGIYILFPSTYIPTSEYSIKITYTDIKTLDKKYLPIPFFGKENNIILDGTFQDTKYDSDGDGIDDTWNGQAIIEDSSDSTLVVGETYTVMWNSVEYRCECIEAMGLIALGNTVAIGGEDNGMPFIISRDVSGAVVDTPSWIAIPIEPEDNGTYFCTISGNSIKKVDLQYLYQPDWNENNRNSGSYIVNRPFGEIAAGTIIVPKQNVNLTIDFADNGELWASIVPNMGLSSYVVEGKNYNINFDESYYMGVGVVQDGMGTGIVYQSDSASILVIDDYDGMRISLIVSNQSGQHNISVTCAEDIVTKIDPKYLPDSLPTVTTDDVGKFLRVGADGTWGAETIPNAEEASF